VPKYIGEATLIFLFSEALRLVGVTNGLFCSSQVFGQGSVVIYFVIWAFWDRLCDFLYGLHSNSKDRGTAVCNFSAGE